MDLKKDILDKAISLMRSKEIEKQRNPEDYNIFSILGMERKEVEAHSAFLYSLLNTEGVHHRGDYFLRKFVQKVMTNIKVSSESELYAQREVAYKDSRIDLIIGVNDKEYAIEIKIDACEQSQQIQRYHELTNNTVYYLTLDKKPPTSCSEEILENVICISFKDEIITWLNDCKANLSKPFDVIIEQYIHLLVRLTQEEKGDKAMMELITGRESFNAITELIAAQTNFKTKFLTDFFHGLQAELDFSEFCYEPQTYEPYFAEYYTGNATYPQLWFEFKSDRQKLELDQNHALFFYIEVTDNLYTFVAIRNKDGSLIENFPEKYNKYISLFTDKKHCRTQEDKYKLNYFWEHVKVDGKLLNFKHQTGLYLQLLAQDNDSNCLFDERTFARIKHEIIKNFEDAKILIKDYLLQ